MPLPASVPTGTVTGRWWNTDGTDAVGSVIFLLQEPIEVPDDPDGVVLPTWHRVPVPAGELNTILPAGTYNASISLGAYRASKTFVLEEGATILLPDADPVPVDNTGYPCGSFWTSYPWGQYDWPYSPYGYLYCR